MSDLEAFKSRNILGYTCSIIVDPSQSSLPCHFDHYCGRLARENKSTSDGRDVISDRQFSFHDVNLGCSRRHNICNTSFLVSDLPSWSRVTRPGRQDHTFGTGRCATASREQTTDVANTSGPVDQMRAHRRHGTPLSLCCRSQSCSCIQSDEIFTRSTCNKELVGIIPAPSISRRPGHSAASPYSHVVYCPTPRQNCLRQPHLSTRPILLSSAGKPCHPGRWLFSSFYHHHPDRVSLPELI